ncbi:MAG: PaaI family thioesterase [Parasphingopyxis sp.]|uniref:PaaI family thioesterase n=1 Tax=Parasphingopyxis sp. TaxID=1920299 RepID=UPI003FA01F97
MSDSQFRHEPDPDDPDWMIWEIKDPERFNALLGKFRVRRETEQMARCRMWPQPIHSNLSDVVHGGVVMSFIDISMFAGSRMLGIEHAGRSVTLDLTCQFMAPGAMDKPLDAEVEILRETGRLVFLRGLVVQDAVKVAAFSGTIRKASPPR